MAIIDDFISVRRFGATGDGVTNDQPFIQSAIDYVLNNPSVTRKLHFPPGTYKINSPLIVYKWNGTNYEFVTIELHGNRTSSFASAVITTNIVATFSDTFAIGIQGGKNCLVEGLSITGQFEPTFATFKDFINAGADFDTYGASEGCRDSRYSPYSGIVIDPFTTSVPPDGGYPGTYINSFYRGSTGTASSAININACNISKFLVNVCYSPNGVTQNTESCNITNSTLETCKVAVAYCQDQTKQCSIRNCISWVYTHTFIDNVTYGQRIGCPANVDGLDLAGAVYRMANIFTYGRVGSAFRNIFAESIFEIGNVGGSSSTISSSHFDFATAVYLEIGAPIHYMFLHNVTVTGTTFRHYDNLFNKRLFIRANNSTFINVHWDVPPILSDAYDIGTDSYPTFIANSYGNTNNNNLIGRTNDSPSQNISLLPFIALQGKFTIAAGISAYGLYEIEYNEISFQRSLQVEGSATVTVNTTLRTATVVISSATFFGYINVNDYLFALVSATPTSLGRVTNLNVGTQTVTLSEVPNNLVTGTFNNIFVNYARLHGHPFIGNCSNGSNVISNVVAPFGYPVIGERIESRFFGQLTSLEHNSIGAYIVSVNSGAGTVTLNCTAAASSNQTTFSCGSPKFTIKKHLDISNYPNEVVFKGLEFIYQTSSASGNNYIIKKYIIERGGLISGTPQAQWYEQVDFRVVSGVGEYWDTPTQAWIQINTIRRAKVTKSHADFATGGTTNSINVFTLPTKGIIHNTQLNPSSVFQGGAIASYTISLGIAGNQVKYAPATNVFTGAPLPAPNQLIGIESIGGTTSIIATAVSTGANLNAATQGAIDFWIYYSVLD